MYVLTDKHYFNFKDYANSLEEVLGDNLFTIFDGSFPHTEMLKSFTEHKKKYIRIEFRKFIGRALSFRFHLVSQYKEYLSYPQSETEYLIESGELDSQDLEKLYKFIAKVKRYSRERTLSEFSDLTAYIFNRDVEPISLHECEALSDDEVANFFTYGHSSLIYIRSSITELITRSKSKALDLLLVKINFISGYEKEEANEQQYYSIFTTFIKIKILPFSFSKPKGCSNPPVLIYRFKKIINKLTNRIRNEEEGFRKEVEREWLYSYAIA